MSLATRSRTTTEIDTENPEGSGAVGGPARTCVGCRSLRPQSQLLRLHLDEGDRLVIDRNGPGRGAWLCRDRAPDCFAMAIERKAFARAFRRSPVPASVEALAGHPMLSVSTGRSGDLVDKSHEKP